MLKNFEKSYKRLKCFWKINYKCIKMSKLENKKIAIVADWIKDWWGAEMVLSHIMEIFPQADIFSSIFYQEKNPIFAGRKITTSFIQKIPFLNKFHKLALTLRPLAFESFDLSDYDIVISSSSAESKWVITKPETLHFVYCHTPTRYFWSHYYEYLNMLEFGILNRLASWLMPSIIHKLRTWDFVASQRADYFIANSYNSASRVAKYYDREAVVIHPWIDSERFIFSWEKEDFYLYVWRTIPYKKFDLLVDAFNQNWKKLVLVTNTDNKLYRDLKSKSKSNIKWELNISREETSRYFSKARAFIFPPEEDFWLVPLEAMACWTPVIAYGKWWALETVIANETGLFFTNQNAESLNNTIEKFEEMHFNYEHIREHALKFDKEIFKENLKQFIEEKL